MKLIPILLVAITLVSIFGYSSVSAVNAAPTNELQGTPTHQDIGSPPLDGNQPAPAVANEAKAPVRGVVTFLTSSNSKVDYNLVCSIDILNLWEGRWNNELSDTLANSKAWLTVEQTGINEAYSKARKFTDIPLEKIVISGDTEVDPIGWTVITPG